MQRLIFLLFGAFPLFLSAQSLTADQAVLNFGETYDTETDSLALVLTNTLDHRVKITELHFYERYGSKDFWAGEDTFSIATGANHTLWVYFHPRQNINYNSELLILTDGNRGNLSVNLRGVGKFSMAAYHRTSDLAHQALKNELKAMTSENQLTLSYNGGRDKMFMEVDNQKVNGQGASVNTLECIYTGTTITGFANRSAAQNQGFNTEHTYPQSLFSQNLPMRSDLHHLFPTTATSNGERGNLPFGTVSNPTWQQGGSRKDNGKFEPRDAQKGLTARAMLYFVVRYQNYSNFLTSQEAILRQWHEAFPPDAIERRRNDDIEGVQGNRNPFIDYPQLLDRISSISNTATAPVEWGLDLGATTADFGLLPALTAAIYTVPVVNYGNQPIQVSQLTLNHPDLSFDGNTGNNATIDPGEALMIRVRLFANTQGSLQASLSMTTNLPGPGPIEIPITAEISGVNAIASPLPSWIRVYPIPAHDTLWLETLQAGPDLRWELWNLAGQRVLTAPLPKGGKQAVSLAGLSPGVYQLRVVSEEGNWTQKIWLE